MYLPYQCHGKIAQKLAMNGAPPTCLFGPNPASLLVPMKIGHKVDATGGNTVGGGSLWPKKALLACCIGCWKPGWTGSPHVAPIHRDLAPGMQHERCCIIVGTIGFFCATVWDCGALVDMFIYCIYWLRHKWESPQIVLLRAISLKFAFWKMARWLLHDGGKVGSAHGNGSSTPNLDSPY